MVPSTAGRVCHTLPGNRLRRGRPGSRLPSSYSPAFGALIPTEPMPGSFRFACILCSHRQGAPLGLVRCAVRHVLGSSQDRTIDLVGCLSAVSHLKDVGIFRAERCFLFCRPTFCRWPDATGLPFRRNLPMLRRSKVRPGNAPGGSSGRRSAGQ